MKTVHNLFGRALLALAIIALLASVALAQEECRVGNLNDPVYPPVPEIFMGEEAYAYYVFPPEQCNCPIDEGFELLSVTQLLHFNDNQIPVVLNVQPVIWKADFDTGQGVFVPGVELFAGQTQTFTIPDNGPVTLTVPTFGSPVFVFDDHYFIGLRYYGGAEGSLLVDDQPAVGIEYINRGNGWNDLNGRDRAGGGKVIVYGDIVCAPLGVEGETDSWDHIKSLYK